MSDVDDILERLFRSSRSMDEIRACPIECLDCGADGTVSFFIDLRHSSAPLLPGFADAEQLVGWLDQSERNSLVTYLVRCHASKFAALVRNIRITNRRWATVAAVGPEIEFTAGCGWVKEVLPK